MTISLVFRPSAVHFAMRGALTVALLVGAENLALARRAGAIEQPAQADGKATERGEAAVTKAPLDPAARAALGKTYLRAGRFEAAASALRDAVALGDGSQGTTLGLALAQIACGRNREALATLDRGEEIIAPAELGLALALAGGTERGIAVLTDGVRDGTSNPRLRENLAYAYALAGRWADARLTASFDLPPDQLDARLQQWAQSIQSGGERVRIAGLLNVPATVDMGMPVSLALNAVPAPEAAIVKGDIAAELPAIAAPALVAMAEPVAPAPFVAAPVPAYLPAVWQLPVHRPAVRIHHAVVNFDHGVQLGAFSSAVAAARAELILARRNPQLRGHGFLITQANVHGRAYWRVATLGYDAETASATCVSLKQHGGACFAYATNHAPLGRWLAMADTAERRR